LRAGFLKTFSASPDRTTDVSALGLGVAESGLMDDVMSTSRQTNAWSKGSSLCGVRYAAVKLIARSSGIEHASA
jgi:hypothetical protein